MKFKKKPVVIDAIHWVYGVTPNSALIKFCEGNLGIIRMPRRPGEVAEAEIGTLEDGLHLTVKHIATSGDYIIKGTQGEFYACKPDIFELTYEKVEE